MSGEMRKEHLEKIEKLFSRSKEFGDDKVQLAMQTYEMVRTETTGISSNGHCLGVGQFGAIAGNFQRC